MSRQARTVLCVAGVAGVAIMLALAFLRMPEFGGAVHVYRDLAAPAAASEVTPNVVSSINFDLRALDTLGEDTIVVASVVGVIALLRPSRTERERIKIPDEQVLPATKLAGYLLLPATVLLGLDVVLHGHLTPGGGFQGGVVLATGWHLLYISGSYPALATLRPLKWCDYAEATGLTMYVLIGVAGALAGGAFLANVLPRGSFGSLLSAGTVPILSVAVGVEVAAGAVVLLAQFLEQGLVLEERNSGG
jgi:multicomponent Na+:H+ antiporter subunit B